MPWTQFTFNYTAPNVTAATLTFALQNDPNFWYLDDVSVTNSSGEELLSNGGFEQGSLLDWIYCNPQNVASAGLVLSGSSTAYSGFYCYKDGSIGAADYLSQTFNVQPNEEYNVSFWLSADGYTAVYALVTISA
jgi:hypothetical protein